MMILTVVVLIAVALIAALWIMGLAGRRRFHAQISKDVGDLLACAGSGVGPEEFASRRRDLPQPVQRYLQYALGENATAIHTVRLRHGGLFRTSPKQRWMTIEGVEYFTVGKPGLVWNGTIRLAPLLWIEARDRLIGDRANMLVKFCSTLKLADASGPEIDQGALLRWLGEVVWFPIGYVGDRIRWEPIDSHSARATLLHEGLLVSAVLEIDDKGKFVRMRAERYRGESDRSVLTPWKALCTEYSEFGGVRIPSSVEVIWELPEGEFSYAKFQVTAVENNIDMPFG
jgi:hypothetical protein